VKELEKENARLKKNRGAARPCDIDALKDLSRKK